MKDVELNPLNSNLRHLLQWGVILILALFLIIYFVFLSKGQNKTKNNTVYLQNGNLQVFDDKIAVSQFPDKLAFHYPYLVIIKPTQKTSIIYNLEEKRLEKNIKEIVLDYYKGNLLFNRGATTFYNKQDLGVLCEKAFIKSQSEILCVTNQYVKENNSKLVSINIKTREQKIIYSSSNLITDVSVMGNDIYFGEAEIQTHNNYIYINNKRIETPDIVSLIYQMNGELYFASFKSVLNNQKESSYLVNKNGAFKKEGEGILFYK